MLKYFSILLGSVWLILLVMLGCGSDLLPPTNTGNPAAVTNLRFVGITSETAGKIASKTLPGGITLTAARVVLEKIEFQPIEACTNESFEDDLEIDFEGPFVVDLLTDTSIPDTSAIELTEDTYCRIELELDELEDDEIPDGINQSDEIVGQAIVVTGTRADTTSFTVLLEGNDSFRIENQSTGFEISSSDTINQFFIAFDLALWFNGVDLDSAALSGNTILIDKDNNRGLLDQIVTNIKASSRLFEDLDDDGELDSDEDDDALGVGEDT